MPKFTAEKIQKLPKEILNQYLRITMFIGQSNRNLFNEIFFVDPKRKPEQTNAYQLERLVNGNGEFFSEEHTPAEMAQVANLMVGVLENAHIYYCDEKEIQEAGKDEHPFLHQLVLYMENEMRLFSMGADVELLDKINPYHKDLREHLAKMPVIPLTSQDPNFGEQLENNEKARDLLNETDYVTLLQKDREYVNVAHNLIVGSRVSESDKVKLKNAVDASADAFRELIREEDKENPASHALNSMVRELEAHGSIKLPKDTHAGRKNYYVEAIGNEVPGYALPLMGQLQGYRAYLLEEIKKLDELVGDKAEVTDVHGNELNRNEVRGNEARGNEININDVSNSVVNINEISSSDVSGIVVNDNAANDNAAKTGAAKPIDKKVSTDKDSIAVKYMLGEADEEELWKKDPSKPSAARSHMKIICIHIDAMFDALRNTQPEAFKSAADHMVSQLRQLQEMEAKWANSPLREEMPMIANLCDEMRVNQGKIELDKKYWGDLVLPAFKGLQAEALTKEQQITNKEDFIRKTNAEFEKALNPAIATMDELASGTAAIQNSVWFGSSEFAAAAGLMTRVSEKFARIRDILEKEKRELKDEDLDEAREALQNAINNAKAYLGRKEGKNITKAKEKARVDKIKESLKVLTDLSFTLEEEAAALQSRAIDMEMGLIVEGEDAPVTGMDANVIQDDVVDARMAAQIRGEEIEAEVTDENSNNVLKKQKSTMKKMVEDLYTAIGKTEKDVKLAVNCMTSIRRDAEEAFAEIENGMHDSEVNPTMSAGGISVRLALYAMNQQELKSLHDELKAQAELQPDTKTKIEQFFTRVGSRRYMNTSKEILTSTEAVKNLHEKPLNAENALNVVSDPTIAKTLVNQYWAYVKKAAPGKEQEHEALENYMENKLDMSVSLSELNESRMSGNLNESHMSGNLNESRMSGNLNLTQVSGNFVEPPQVRPGAGPA